MQNGTPWHALQELGGRESSEMVPHYALFFSEAQAMNLELAS